MAFVLLLADPTGSSRKRKRERGGGGDAGTVAAALPREAWFVQRLAQHGAGGLLTAQSGRGDRRDAQNRQLTSKSETCAQSPKRFRSKIVPRGRTRGEIR